MKQPLVLKNAPSTAKAVQAIVNAPRTLLKHPRVGEPIEDFDPREVRQRLLIPNCELRYEVQQDGGEIHIPSSVYLVDSVEVHGPSHQIASTCIGERLSFGGWPSRALSSRRRRH